MFSGSRCKNACNCLQIFAHVFINRQDLVSFACWIVTEFWSFTRKSVPHHLVIRALNCTRFCVICALNCARILVVRMLDCAQFLLHPALLPTVHHLYMIDDPHLEWWDSTMFGRISFSNLVNIFVGFITDAIPVWVGMAACADRSVSAVYIQINL